MNGRPGRWERQLKEACSLLGFSVDERWDCDGRVHYSRVRLKCGRAHVMRMDRSCAWRSCQEAAVMSSVAIDASKDYEGACRDVMRQLSGSELIVRATEAPRRSKWGSRGSGRSATSGCLSSRARRS